MKESIKYSDLCKAFYNKTKSKSGFKHYQSQGKIAEFLTVKALSENSLEIMPTSTASFNKWFSGENGQDAAILTAIRHDLPTKLNDYSECLAAEFVIENIPSCATQLGLTLSTGETLDVSKFAFAIAKQLLLLAENNGEYKNQISEIYYLNDVSIDFSDYINKATTRYNVMKFIGAEEAVLSEYYVCNTLGDKAVAKNNRHSYKGTYLDDATIEKIRSLYKFRGIDNKKCILIGSGGSGKSLMLQHLFLDGLAKYSKTGILPIFLELRNFRQSDSIESFIYDAVNVKDETYTKEISHQMLLDGNCVLLLDGFDEIDPTDINDFQKKLNDFTDTYSNVQVILASRQCDAIKGLNLYIKLYVWPFDEEQSTELINTIIKKTGSTATVDEITSFLSNGFLKKDGIFSSHPMLLSYIALNHDSLPAFKKDHLLFYRATYDALLTGHDDNKHPYDRVFHSVDNADQFSIVFREFCAITYKKGVFSFDNSSFDQFFSELTSYKNFENTHKMTSSAFKHDACSTACIMFEENLGIWYIDPGFQEFLFAEYYASAPAAEVIDLQKSLSRLPLATFERFDALDMLFKCSEEKFKYYLLLPFLESIIQEKNDNPFMFFLENTFDTINLTAINEEKQNSYMSECNLRYPLYPVVPNHPKSILVNYISKILGLDAEYDFSLYTLSNIDPHSLIDDHSELTGLVLGRNGLYKNEHVLELSCQPLHVYEYLNNELINGNTNNYFIGENEMLEQFGYRVAINSTYLELEPEKYSTLINNAEAYSPNTTKVFKKLLNYYKLLTIEKRRSGL